MPPTNTQRHDFGNSTPSDGNGGNGPTPTASAQIDINDLVNKCAEAVMSRLGNQNANAGGGPTAAAYRANAPVDRHIDDDAQVTAGPDGKTGKTSTGAGEEAGMVSEKADKNTLAIARGVAKKHGISVKAAYGIVAAIDKHGPKGAAKRAMWAQVSDAGNPRDENDDYEDMDGEWHTRQRADTGAIQRNAEIADLKAQIDDLNRHRAEEQQVMKKTILTQKFQTLVASGHAIGDSATIDRHVNRCMKFSTQEIEDYLADLKANAPRIKVSNRYSDSEGIIRDPSGSSRSSAMDGIDPADAQRYGLDEDILKLAEALPGM